MKRLASLALLLLLPATLVAQRIAPPMHFGGHANAPRFVHRGDHSGYYPIGLFDPYYSDYLSNAGYSLASQPPVILLQSPPASAANDPAPVPAPPLMIELRGDRYVQISGDESSRSQMLDALQVTPSEFHQASQHPTNPAILIFRDGHRQEVSAYTIAEGVLYAATDYATTGSWTQRVELALLNVPETIAENKARNVPFQLPTAPNEVVVGP